MADNKKDIKNVWFYAVILFTGAFALLLLTAFSQIKQNNSLSDSRTNKQQNQEKSFQENLSSSLSLNKKLNEKLKSVTDELNTVKLNERTLSEKLNQTHNKYEDTIKSYEAFLKAEKEYKKGNFIASARLLKEQCNKSALGKEAEKKYSALTRIVYPKAGSQLFVKGYNEYLNKNYKKAMDNFQLSIKIIKNQYYSDDCYYYLAYSQYKSGQVREAEKTLKTLLDKYPKSTLKTGANLLLERIANG